MNSLQPLFIALLIAAFAACESGPRSEPVKRNAPDGEAAAPAPPAGPATTEPAAEPATDTPWTNVCVESPGRTDYCDDVGRTAHNATGPEAARAVELGPIVGVAWRPKGSLVSNPDRDETRTADRDAFHYIIGPGGVADYHFLREAREIDPR